MKRRHFILLLGGASSGALGIGTGAFSSVEADRGVEVNVVEDENAYLGLERLDAASEVDVGYETDVVKITNQFADGLDLSVVVDEQGDGIDEIEVEDPVEIVEEADEGESDGEDLPTGTKAHVSVKCDSPGDTSFTLTFSGHAGGASVDKTRTFEISCESVDTGPTVNDVKFLGNGKVKILSDGGGQVSAKAYIGGPGQSGNGEPQWTSYTHVSVNEELKPKQFGWDNNGDEILEVDIDGVGTFEK